jgi:hypothetical protein
MRLLLDVVYRGAMLRRTRRTLEHWYPELGAYEDWLADRAAEGWVREHSGALTAVIVNGRRVWPVALINELSRNRLLARLRASCRAMMRHHEVRWISQVSTGTCPGTSTAGCATLEVRIIHTPVNVFPATPLVT